MRRMVVFVITLVLLFGGVATTFAQDGAFEEEGWKKRFAAPTYGLVLTPLELRYDDGNEEVSDTIMVPGIELRIFNGINVAKRGGFYTGYEVGVAFFFLDKSESYNVFGSDNQNIVDLLCGSIYLMSKYGYRLDLGTEVGGLSIGPMIGIGATMGGGNVDIYRESDGYSTGADTDMIFGPRVELGIEGAFRFGKNFRLLGVLGVAASPTLEWSGSISGEMSPVRPDLRLGFALNY